MAMQVELPETGTMIFTSDAIYMGDSYGPPSVPAAIVNDLTAWYASVEKIRTIAERTDATVVFGHDAEQLRSMRLAPAGSYS
jgi:glyoxylase-like metal-dependent hydrolase (beta-lactamase superfamily II)